VVNGNLKKTEKRYFESKITKRGYRSRATLGYYNPEKLGSFTLINIGPYETEEVCYFELQKQLKKVETQGYSLANKTHAFPAVIIQENTNSYEEFVGLK
jgi:hypothetical protein